MSNPVGYRSIVGKRFGLGPNGPVYNGVPVGSQPQALVGGKTFYVSSQVDGASGESPEEAAGTLQEIIDKIDLNSDYDNVGTTIIVLPNHAEIITGVGGLTFDVAGLRVIGLGTYNQRPRFLMDGANTVTAAVTADDVYLENLVFAAGHSDIASCFDVDAKGFTMVGCEFVDNTAKENFLVGILSGSTTDNVCDGLTLIGNTFFTSTDSHTSFATLVGDTDFLHVEGNIYMQGAPGGSSGSAGIFLNGTAGDDWKHVLVKDNVINIHQTATDSYPLGGGNDQTDNTGLMVGNVVASRISVGTSAAAGQNLFTKGTGFNWVKNHFSGKGTDAGQIIPFPTSGGAAY